MHDQNLHTSFWVEASNTVVYIQNKCPHSVLENTTPEEVFTGIKPDLSHLRIFGCPVYIHIPKEKRTKLEPSGKKGILIGYSETTKGYWVFISSQRAIEINKNVKFEEDIAFNISRNSDESITVSIPEVDENQQVEIERENDFEPSSSTMSIHEDFEIPIIKRGHSGLRK